MLKTGASDCPPPKLADRSASAHPRHRLKDRGQQTSDFSTPEARYIMR